MNFKIIYNKAKLFIRKTNNNIYENIQLSHSSKLIGITNNL